MLPLLYYYFEEKGGIKLVYIPDYIKIDSILN